MLEALKANKKLSAEIEGGHFEKYEVGLRTLKDDLSMAILAEEDEQTVDTLGGIFKHLAWALASATHEVKQRTVECLSDEFGVRLAASVDIQTMLVEVDSPGTAEGSQAKRNKSSEGNDVASDADYEDSDDMEGEGEDRDPANDDGEPIEITGPISSSTPTPAPAPSPRASRPTVRMLWGLTDPPDTPPGGKKHPRDLPDTAKGSKAKRNKSFESNDAASNASHQGSDDVEGEGEDRNPAGNNSEEPNEITRPISTPASAPAPTPRVSRTAVHVYHGV